MNINGRFARLLLAGAVALACAGCGSPAVPVARQDMGLAFMVSGSVSVETPLGTVNGRHKSGVASFKGVPYAKPPVGELRFAPTEPIDGYETPISALEYGAHFVQEGEPLSKEDALTLNIYTPATGVERLPVYVYIHGGAFATGSNSRPTFEGSKLAQKGVVVVTVNYRLNALGFLSLKSSEAHSESTDVNVYGNYGLLDQIEALKWIKNNIQSFGGDPTNVTVGGESAGSISVSMLILSPLAEGLFNKAIMQSGNLLGNSALQGLSDGSQEVALETSRRFAAMFGAKDDKDGLARLRAIEPRALAEASVFDMDLTSTQSFSFWPMLDGKVIPKDPYEALLDGDYNKVDILWGYNSDEYSLFMPPEVTQGQYLAYMYKSLGERADGWLERYPITNNYKATDAMADYIKTCGFMLGNKIYSDKLSEQGSNVYAYRFDCKSPVSVLLGSYHAMELSYVFGNGLEAMLLDDKGMEISEQMQTLWTNFIKNADPNEGLPLPMGGNWAKYDPQDPQLAYFGEEFKTEPLMQEDEEKLEFLEELLLGDDPYYLH